MLLGKGLVVYDDVGLALEHRNQRIDHLRRLHFGQLLEVRIVALFLEPPMDFKEHVPSVICKARPVERPDVPVFVIERCLFL